MAAQKIDFSDNMRIFTLSHNGMEKLVVKNFGPIASAEIDVRQFTLLVGHVSSGKSTIAKLLAIFDSTDLYRIQYEDRGAFIKILKDYNIDYSWRKNTIIKYANDYYEWEITSNDFHTSFKYAEIVDKIHGSIYGIRESIQELSDKYPIYDILGDEIEAKLQVTEPDRTNVWDIWSNVLSKIIKEFHLPGISIYIPAERNIFTIVEGNIFNMFNEKISIPKNLLEFGGSYESSKNRVSRVSIPFLQGIKVDFVDEDNNPNTRITLSNGESLPMRQASSGLQSLIPLFTILHYYGLYSNMFIEEPEANLFPSVQKDLVGFIVETSNRALKNRCVITTHSPYILSSFDALVQAGNASEKNYLETTNIVPPERWIKYDDISCYFFDDKGKVTPAKNDELKNIGSEIIDGVSDTINDEYDKLLNIIYS